MSEVTERSKTCPVLRKWVCPACRSVVILKKDHNGLAEFDCCGRTFDIRPAYFSPKKPKLRNRDCGCGGGVSVLTRYAGLIRTKCCRRVFCVKPDHYCLFSIKKGITFKENEVLDLKNFKLRPAFVAGKGTAFS